MRRVVVASCLGALVFASGGLAMAQDGQKEDKPFEEYFTFGAGPIGNFGAVFLSKPNDRTFPLANGTRGETNTYPGFTGPSLGGGLALEFRFIDYLGIELDMLYAKQKGGGDLSINDHTSVIRIGENSFHVPLLFKVVLPGKVVQPSLFVGPEFVMPGDPQIETDPPFAAGTPAPALLSVNDKYTMVTFGLGMEFRIPSFTKYLDIRIPLSLRGGFNPGVGSVLDPDRATYQGTGFEINQIQSITYKSVWEWQAQGTIGATIHILPSGF